MKPHLRIPVVEASQVGEARRAAAQLALDHGLDELNRARLAIVVTELANNLALHAKGGVILLGAIGTATMPAIEVLSVDASPGMQDVNACLVDGYSTGNTPGTGFGAAKRQSDTFSVYSRLGQGTAIRSRVGAAAVHPPGAFEVAGISISAPGEIVSGDAWGWTTDCDIGRVLLADGLGHGPEAAEAADAATAFFQRTPGAPSQLLTQAHDILRGTRGAAVAMAHLSAADRSVTFAGAGNVAGRLLSGIEDRTLLSQPGTLGVQIRRLTDIVYPWPPHACLILYSDGIVGRWSLSELPGLLQADVALIAAWVLHRHGRGRDDATVVVVRLTEDR